MKRLAIFCLLVLAAGLASEGLRSVRVLHTAEETLWDLRLRFFSPETAMSRDIVIVALDEETMQSLPYRSPIPRRFLAELQRRLAESGPRLIAYDIFFKDKSFRSDDEQFARALEAFPPYAVSLGRDMPEGIAEDLPNPVFQSGLAGIGLADLPLNPFSQVMRQATLEYETANGRRPTFVALLYGALTKQRAVDTLRGAPIRFGGITFPVVGPEGSMIIRYVRPAAGPEGKPVLPTYSARLVAEGAIPSVWLHDKIIFVGATFNDAQDLFLTPYYSASFGYRRVPGVEIHAQILSSLLTHQYIGRFTPMQERFYILALLLLMIWSTWEGRSWRWIIAPLIIPVAQFSASVLLFRLAGIMVPVVVPFCGVLFAYGITLGWRTFSEGRQRRWLKSTFSKYVSPTVVEELVRHPERVSLGGERRVITCLFSDIANFTTMSERLQPEQVVTFLNDYLGELSQAILDQGGTIDKYEGDSIVAFFGAPVPMQNHAVKAVTAALTMQASCERLSKKWESTLGQPVVTRVGIHTGTAVVGNIGSEVRFDYTAIGDTVNIASRLEGINKEHGTRVTISEATRQLLPSTIPVRALGRARLKGKSEELPIYEAIV